jgi:hypothetical protein
MINTIVKSASYLVVVCSLFVWAQLNISYHPLALVEMTQSLGNLRICNLVPVGQVKKVFGYCLKNFVFVKDFAVMAIAKEEVLMQLREF